MSTTATSLSSARFTFERYVGRVGYSTNQLYEFVPDAKDIQDVPKLLPGVQYVGHCSAANLAVRPRDEGIAVMVTFQNELMWFHIDQLPINI